MCISVEIRLFFGVEKVSYPPYWNWPGLCTYSLHHKAYITPFLNLSLHEMPRVGEIEKPFVAVRRFFNRKAVMLEGPVTMLDWHPCIYPVVWP